MPKKSIKNDEAKAEASTKKKASEDKNRDNSGRFTTGNEFRFDSGIEPHPTLRRTCKYKPEYAQMLIDYFNEPLYEERVDSFGKTYRLARPVPSKIGFSRRLGVWYDTVDNWAKMKKEDGTPRFPEFTKAWELVEQYDRQNITDASLGGTHNGNFGRFLLSAKYGMKEKTDTESTITIKVESENQDELDDESV